MALYALVDIDTLSSLFFDETSTKVTTGTAVIKGEAQLA
jgi:hypothetical protein